MVQIVSQNTVSNYGVAAVRTGQQQGPSAIDFIASNNVATSLSSKDLLLKLFGEHHELQRSFETTFSAEMQKAKDKGLLITDENGMHNALVSVILENRNMFPAGPITIKTELPGGGSMVVTIPGSGQDANLIEPETRASSYKLSGLLGNIAGRDETPTSLAISAYASVID